MAHDMKLAKISKPSPKQKIDSFSNTSVTRAFILSYFVKSTMNPTWIFVSFIISQILLGSVEAQCSRDSYNNLPGLPQAPSTPYPGTPALASPSSYVQGHWSEMAQLANFRPQKDPNTLAGGTIKRPNVVMSLS